MSEVMESVELSPAGQGHLNDIRRKMVAKKRLEGEIIDLQDKIKNELGDNSIANVKGVKVLSWMSTDTTKFDLKKGKELIDPTLLAKCYTTSSIRSFRLVEAK